MNYSVNCEMQLDEPTKNLLGCLESLYQLQLHVLSHQAQFRNSSIRHRGFTLDILSIISDECEGIRKILSPNS